MIKYICHMFLLLLMVLPVMATPYEQKEEYKQKQAILNERAARFKAETGFEGNVSFNHQYMSFSTLHGNFKDIVVSAPQDTVFMRQVFEQVVSKVMPYISAREGQLFGGKVVSNSIGSRVIYTQIVNGYPIDGGLGSLKIGYNLSTSVFSITDATVDIASEIVHINITMEQAILLARNEMYQGADVLPHNPRIAYTEVHTKGGSNFYLCYILAFWDNTVCVDVSNSLIRKTTPNKISQ